MEFHLIPHSLPGFADTQTIRIVYDIPTGIQVSPPRTLTPTPLTPSKAPDACLWFKPLLLRPQGPEHPNPGKKFTARGFPRHCYLPNNEKGRKVGAGLWARAPATGGPACEAHYPQSPLSHSSPPRQRPRPPSVRPALPGPAEAKALTGFYR